MRIESVAQYAIMLFLERNGFALDKWEIDFDLVNEKAVLTDRTGRSIIILYDADTDNATYGEQSNAEKDMPLQDVQD